MFTLVLIIKLIIKLYVLANIVTAKNALFNITCESSSKCGNVVIENEDKFNCFTEIDEDFKKNNITEYSLRFYVETKNTHIERNNATHDCQVKLNKGCQKEEKKDCSCTGNYYIDWNLTALYEKHNNARIQARLFNSSSRTIYSNFHPGARIIKDPRNVTFMLFVNNKEVPDNGIINIAKDDDEILFNISPKELSDVLRLHYGVNDQITSGQKIRVKPQNINLKIKLCDRELRSYNLSLLYDAHQPENAILKILIALLVILILVCMVMVLFIIWIWFKYYREHMDYWRLLKKNLELQKLHWKLTKKYQEKYADREDFHRIRNEVLESCRNESLLKNMNFYLTKWNLKLNKRIQEIGEENQNYNLQQWTQDLERRNDYLSNDIDDLNTSNHYLKEEIQGLKKKNTIEGIEPGSEEARLTIENSQ